MAARTLRNAGGASHGLLVVRLAGRSLVRRCAASAAAVCSEAGGTGFFRPRHLLAGTGTLLAGGATWWLGPASKPLLRKLLEDPEAADAERKRLATEREQQRVADLAEISGQASWLRLASLAFTMLPIAFYWPIWFVNPGYFWQLVASRLESCGPCFVKLSQWLATRRDLFPETVCIALGKMHGEVSASWAPQVSREHVEEALQGAELQLRSLDSRPHASGSIAEVFFGVLQDGTAVAVKCLRPGVKDLLVADLAWLLRFGEWTDRNLRLRMLGVRRAAEDFCEHVQMQTNFEVEASHLRRFRRNFEAGNESVRFPIPLFATEDVIVMSREEGREMAHIFADMDNGRDTLELAGRVRGRAADASTSRVPKVQVADDARNGNIGLELGPDEPLKRVVARESIAAYMRMVFCDAFIHGDLHPGNIMLRVRQPEDSAGSSVLSDSMLEVAASRSMAAQESESQQKEAVWTRIQRQIRNVCAGLTGSTQQPRFELVILDAGLAIPLPQEKVEALRSLAIAIIYGDFGRAAEILYQQSPDTSRCWDPAAFKTRLAAAFRNCRKNIWEDGFVQVSDACLEALHLVQHYNVGLDTTLTWALFGMLSVEGSAKRLDPEVDAAGAAMRYIITLPSLRQELAHQSWGTCWQMFWDATYDLLPFRF